MPVPTRAETLDVATAIYEGDDAVMLSAESVFGKLPVEAVRMLSGVIDYSEADPFFVETMKESHSLTR